MASNPDSEPSATVARSGVRALVILAILCLAGVLSQFLRSSHAAIAPEVIKDLALSAEGFGLVTSAFFFAYALSQIPVGVLLDRFGPRRTIPAGLTLALLGSHLFGVAQTPGASFAGRFLMGVGCAPIFMGAFVACTRWFPPDRFGTVAGIIAGTGYAGSIFAATPMAAASETLGWRTAFFVVALITAAIGAVVFAVVRDAPPGRAAPARARESLGTIVRGVLLVLTNRQMHRLLAIALVGYATIATVFSLWVGPYFHDVHGLDNLSLGNALLALAIATVVGSMAYGALDRVFNTRKWLVLGGAALTVLLHAIMAAWPRPGVIAATVVLTLLCVVASFAVIITVHGRALFPDHMAGRAMTTVNLGHILGAAVVQSVSGLIVGAFPSEGGGVPEEAYRAVFAFLAVVTAIAMLGYWRIRDVKPGEPAPNARTNG